VIVVNIWPKLFFNEHKSMLIVIDNWRFFSQISGQTLFIVINIWPNQIAQILTVLIGKDHHLNGFDIL
jgi:hypothetical protein